MAVYKREYDLVLMGATGFTGRLVAEYLLEQYGVDETLSWAIAGRNQARLEAVLLELQGDAPETPIPLILADAGDRESLAELAQSTRVVCSTVGPYALHGSGLVEACARFGTDYCDLTGEVQWMHRMIREHQASAAASGARIVHCCGFDSIPSDIGTWYLQQQMIERHGQPASHIKCRIGEVAGAMSGGTLASAMNMLDEVARDPSLRKVVADPYALLPPGAPRGDDGPDQARAVYDEDFQRWTIPFVMASINMRVVRRSNALLEYEWGEDFRYDEAVLLGASSGRLAASGMAGAMQAGMGVLAIKPLRRLATRWLPAPGEGPDRETREKGYFKLEFLGLHPTDPGKNLHLQLNGQRDPGYGATSRMLGESAVCLAQDALDTAGGFWTPASAMGQALKTRLEASAGMDFTIEE